MNDDTPSPPRSGNLKRLNFEPSSGDHDSNRRRLAINVLDMDDASHARLDQQVLAIAGDEPFGLSLAGFLLTTIVQTSDGLLYKRNGDNGKAMALLAEHADLQEKLRVAWKARSFKDIRNLGTKMTQASLILAENWLVMMQISFVQSHIRR